MRKKNEMGVIFEHLLRSKRSKQLLRDVGSGEFGSNALQRVLLDLFNSELLALLEPETTKPSKIPTAVVREYIERGEHCCCHCTLASTGEFPPGSEVRRGPNFISFV